MGSQLREKKYLHVFNWYLDYNKDGHIDRGDVDLVISKIREYRKLRPGDPEYRRVQDIWYEILDSLLEDLDANKDGEVSLDEWKVVCDRYVKNLSKPPKWQTLYEDFVYQYMNPNNKPGIAKEDYVKLMEFYGFPEDSSSAAFDKISKGKGIITEAEYRQLWAEFFSSEDPNAPGSLMWGFVP